MAGRGYRNQTFTPNIGEVWISGGFVCNGASNPVLFQGPTGLNATLPNSVSSIVRTGAGTYTISLIDNFYCLLYGGLDLAMGTPTNNYAQFNGFTNINVAGALPVGTMSIFVGAGVADLAAGGNTNIVSFTFCFKNSSAY